MLLLFSKVLFIWIILKVYIEFVIILVLFYVLDFPLQGMWDLSFPTPVPPALEGKVLTTGTSLGVQWLGLCLPALEVQGLGS